MYSYTPTAVDGDGDPMTFSFTGMPSWLSFTNGKLLGTPTWNHIGIHGPITIRVIDSVGASDSVSFSIEVEEAEVGSLPAMYLLLLGN